jgi:hypothetical protein
VNTGYMPDLFAVVVAAPELDVVAVGVPVIAVGI